jgi:hypothetical protein
MKLKEPTSSFKLLRTKQYLIWGRPGDCIKGPHPIKSLNHTHGKNERTVY